MALYKFPWYILRCTYADIHVHVGLCGKFSVQATVIKLPLNPPLSGAVDLANKLVTLKPPFVPHRETSEIYFTPTCRAHSQRLKQPGNSWPNRAIIRIVVAPDIKGYAGTSV